MEEYTEIFTNEGDAVLRKACENLYNFKAHHNRKYVYEPTEAGFKRFQEDTEKYFAWCRSANLNLEDGKKPIIPDVEGWATSLSLTRVSIFRYHKERGEPWTSYIEFVREQITAIKKQYGLSGKIPPMTLVFDLVNNSNYLNTSCFNNRLAISKTDGVKGIGLKDLANLIDSDPEGGNHEI